MSSRPDAPDRDDHLHQVIAAYLEASESGRAPDRGTLLSTHPDLAEKLREYFSALDEVNTLVADLTPLPRSRDQTPRRFGPYDVVEEIGRGGMGVVYRARQRVPDRLVALKMIRPALWVTTADARRFRIEAESAARLDHPNIVPIFEIGESDGHLFFSMKLCPGGNLAGLVVDGRPVPDPSRAVELVATVARAIHHAHQRGILHRDLKPSNILLDEAGRPYVADFGLAKVLDGEGDLTATGAVLGTPGYLAPETVPALAAGPKGCAPVATTGSRCLRTRNGAVLSAHRSVAVRGRDPGGTLALVQARSGIAAIRQSHRRSRPCRRLPAVPGERPGPAPPPSAGRDLGRWMAGKPTRHARSGGWPARGDGFSAIRCRLRGRVCHALIRERTRGAGGELPRGGGRARGEPQESTRDG